MNSEENNEKQIKKLERMERIYADEKKHESVIDKAADVIADQKARGVRVREHDEAARLGEFAKKFCRFVVAIFN